MVDGGGVEEKQNNCAIVTTEKKETSVTSTSNYVLDFIQKKGPIIARYTTHDHLVRGRLYLFTFSESYIKNTIHFRERSGYEISPMVNHS